MLTGSKALHQDVVNKIAAGEIIVAPVNALKELLENAVDAGSTSIEILVKEGGLKLLQITDNGHGIDKDDMPILCERFTTSKLKAFEDLTSIATYGFRGEALASISHIAHLRVTTKTAGSSCAWQAHYADGKLTPAKPGQSADPKPCAGRGGTQITVEDLFYSIPNRRRAFRSASEEYAKILELVGKYSVHCSHVAFSIKKHGDSGAGFSISANASKLDRIKLTHGTAVGKEIVSFDCEDKRWGFRGTGYASNANHNGKRTMLLLFINHRSVESSAIKKAIEQTYSLFLPKGGKPFVYLSLEIEPARVDVNVHPTKREVHFLNEDEIIEVVCNDIREKLAQVDTSRTFKTQTLLPGMTSITPVDVIRDASSNPARGDGLGPKTPATKKPYENNLVRTDSSMRKITSMLPPALATHQSAEDAQTTSMDGLHYEMVDREQVQIRLTSVRNLRAAVRDEMHNSLTEAFAALTYVGLVDANRRLAAIQSGVKLFLVDYGMASNEFFYQIGLTDFGNFGRIQLNPPPSLKDVLSIAAKHEVANSPDAADLDPEHIVNSVYDQIMSRKPMLKEYFALDISDEGQLLTIPLLLKGYKPCMAKLPMFLLRLGPFVDWTHEQQCFHTFLVELASFYVPEQLPSTPRKGEDESESIVKRRKEMEFVLEHVLFPAMRSRIVATKGMMQGVVEVANLKGLYRVFERC
jgi:DNA mismatch repair protein MLH1